MRNTKHATIKNRRRAASGTKGPRSKAGAAARKVSTTLGELIAAAFDTVGNEVKDVARLLSSRELLRTNRRIVLVQ